MQAEREPDEFAMTYGRDWAGRYDDLYDDRDDTALAVEFLARYASPRTVLELGVGSGRLAVPLTEAGLRVHGVDASAEMLRLLSERPGGDKVTVSCADMTSVALGEQFGVVLIAFSTLYLLRDAEDQLRCLETAARHLAPQGSFIVETFVMDPNRWHDHQSVSVTRWEADHLTLKVGMLNRTDQVIETADIDIHQGRTDVLRNRLRYVQPSELDLMARIAGLRLVDRFGSLVGDPFEVNGGNAVSVYRLS